MTVMHWDLRAGSWMALASAMTAVETKLQELEGSGAIHRSPVRWVSAGFPTAIPRIEEWSPRFRMNTDGTVRSAGTLARRDPVWAGLFLFALAFAMDGKAEQGEISFADENGDEIALRPSSMAVLSLFSETLDKGVLKQAGELGLIPYDVRLSDVRCEVGDFWF